MKGRNFEKACEFLEYENNCLKFKNRKLEEGQTEAEKIVSVMRLADESLNPDDHTELQRIIAVLCVTRGIMVVPE